MNLRCIILFWIGFSLTVFGMLFGNVEKVQAESMIELGDYIPDIFIKVARPDGTGRYEQGRFIRSGYDGSYIYCLEPFRDVIYDADYEIIDHDYGQYISLTEDTWKRVQLLSYYGYGYSDGLVDHVSDARWYTITQVLIWRTVDPSADIYFTDTVNGNRNDYLFLDEIGEMERLVSEHFIEPKFDDDIILTLGQEKISVDRSGVLDEFEVVDVSGGKAQILDGSLSIMATEVDEFSVTLAKKDRRYMQQPFLYYSSVSQNLIGVGSFEPVVLQLTYPVVGGQVEIRKKDRDTGLSLPQGGASLDGAIYGVYRVRDDGLVAELVTDQYGYAISDYLPVIEAFYLQEIKPSEGYLLDEMRYYFTLNTDQLLVSMSVFEDVIERVFEITKVYASDMTQIMTPEVGVEFGVYRDDELVLTDVTDQDGKISFTLPYGSYVLRQHTTTSGYEKLEDYSFVVDEVGPTVSMVMGNALLRARLRVVKVDENGEVVALSGIRFRIKNIDLNEYVCQSTFYPNVERRCEFETDLNGMFFFPDLLSNGNYQLEEVDQMMPGYVWNSKPHVFQIDEKSIMMDELYGPVVEVRFCNQSVKGRLEIHKLGEVALIQDGNYFYGSTGLSGVRFGLYDERGKLVREVVTDLDGRAYIDNLELGRYILKELESASGYILDPKEYEVIFTYQDQYTPVVELGYTFVNELEKGKFRFVKVDAESGDRIEGVEIQIYTEDGRLVFTGVTSANGEIEISDLFLGSFYVVETRSADGYLLNSGKIPFVLHHPEEEVVVTMKNERLEMPNTFVVDEVNVFSLFGTGLVGLGLLIGGYRKHGA